MIDFELLLLHFGIFECDHLVLVSFVVVLNVLGLRNILVALAGAQIVAFLFELQSSVDVKLEESGALFVVFSELALHVLKETS